MGFLKPDRYDSFGVAQAFEYFRGNRLWIALQGHSRPGSDIDLALQGEGRTLTDLLCIFNELYDLLLPALIDLLPFERRGESFLLDHVPISGRVVPGKRIREDYPLYPPLATRGAVANAICHRDYTTAGGAVAIAMYDDHLEIINPGILHFDMTPEKLEKPHESKPWNPIIASVFYRAGVIEKWGMGTLNIIDWCKENGNPKPTWEVRAESVVTTFLPSGFFATGEMPDERPKLRPKIRPKLRPKIEEEVVKLLRKGLFSKAEIAELLGHQHISGGLKKSFSEFDRSGCDHLYDT